MFSVNGSSLGSKYVAGRVTGLATAGDCLVVVDDAGDLTMSRLLGFVLEKLPPNNLSKVPSVLSTSILSTVLFVSLLCLRVLNETSRKKQNSLTKVTVL